MAKNYHPQDIEPKWQERWWKEGIYEVDLDKAKKPFFNLMMFPYPSAEGLHVGNMYAFTGADIYGRFQRMQGQDVFEPIGLDGFGIHSENYALKIKEHPKDVAKRTEKNFYRQLHQIGNSFAWKNTLETYDSNYYKWTQWIFIQLFKAGLAERKKAAVNWCPSCKTTLSDEQVIAGICERCKTEVEKRELEQWFFKITNYAERLLKNLDWIDWSERTKIAQKNWIGKSEGILIEFPVSNFPFPIPVFTTRPDTIFGATFFVLAPESDWVKKLTKPKYQKEVNDYVVQAKKKTEIQRLSTEKEKTGVFTGSYVINPATDKKIPVWVADYVVLGYGTGAIMGVPAHDQRDWEFAKEHNLPIIEVISGGDISKGAYDGEGKLVNSGQFNGLSKEGIKKITAWLEKKGLAKKQVQYRLRDWCISRQRYWGPPIPMIHCPKCGWQPVPEKDLPVLLPYIKDYRPKGVGTSPLARCKDWVKIACPECGGAARRETDVSDTFLDSAWYFLGYLILGNQKAKRRIPSECKKQKIGNWKLEFKNSLAKRRQWLPVDMYIGGHEHACLHLMYTRFLTMVFKDLGLIDFSGEGGPRSAGEEPFKRFYAHGLLISEGAKMSKSKGNIVIPDEYIKKFGADTLRTYLMFLGPFDQGGDFRDRGIAGMYRFFARVWRIAQNTSDGGPERSRRNSSEVEKKIHQTIKKVTEDIQNLRYNTAIAGIMKYVNFLYSEKRKVQSAKVSREAIETLALLLAPFAPHIAEEIYSQLYAKRYTLNASFSIHQQKWPQYDEKLIKEEVVTIVVQVNGKVRGQIYIKHQTSNIKHQVEKLARKEKNVARYLEGKKIKKVVFVPGKLINFVV